MVLERDASELTKMERIRQGLEGREERIRHYQFSSDATPDTGSSVSQMSSEIIDEPLTPIGLDPLQQQG